MIGHYYYYFVASCWMTVPLIIASYYYYIIIVVVKLTNIILMNINLLYKSRHASWVGFVPNPYRAHESADSQ